MRKVLPKDEQVRGALGALWRVGTPSPQPLPCCASLSPHPEAVAHTHFFSLVLLLSRRLWSQCLAATRRSLAS